MSATDYRRAQDAYNATLPAYEEATATLQSARRAVESWRMREVESSFGCATAKAHDEAAQALAQARVAVETAERQWKTTARVRYDALMSLRAKFDT